MLREQSNSPGGQSWNLQSLTVHSEKHLPALLVFNDSSCEEDSWKHSRVVGFLAHEEKGRAQGFPEDLSATVVPGVQWGRREGQCPRKATRTKPCPRSNPCPSPFSLDKPGIPPRAGHWPLERGVPAEVTTVLLPVFHPALVSALCPLCALQL